MSELEKLYELASFLINERGYVVLGTGTDCYFAGQITHKIWNTPIGQPVRILQKTDAGDARTQVQLAKAKFGVDYLRARSFTQEKSPNDYEGYYYWRAITD